MQIWEQIGETTVKSSTRKRVEISASTVRDRTLKQLKYYEADDRRKISTIFSLITQLNKQEHSQVVLIKCT